MNLHFDGLQEFGKVLCLTETQQAILKLLGQGRTTTQLAKVQCVSVKTIDTHLQDIAKRLGLKGTSQLRVFAGRYSLWSEMTNVHIVEKDNMIRYEFKPKWSAP